MQNLKIYLTTLITPLEQAYISLVKNLYAKNP